MGVRRAIKTVRRRLEWRWGDVRSFVADRYACVCGDGQSAEFDRLNRECAWRRAQFLHDPEIGWRCIPHLRARVLRPGGYYWFRTNSDGFRSDREFARTRAAGIARIAVFGDSFTAGDGVDNRDRFSDLIEKTCAGLEVFNMGLSGSGTDQQVLLMEREKKTLGAGAYILCIYVENVFRNRMAYWPAVEWSTGEVRYRAKPYFVLSDGRLSLRNVPVPNEVRSAAELGDWRRDHHGYLTEGLSYETAYGSSDSPWCQVLGALIRRFVDAAGGTPVLVVPLPTEQHIRGQATPVYRAFFQGLGGGSLPVRVVDPLPAFLAMSKAERRKCTIPRDHHYTPLGHRVVADVLLDAVRGVVRCGR
jgi:carbamoyltransferase